MDEVNQSINQQKTVLARSEHSPIIIELMKDLISQSALVGQSEYETVVNAVRFDTQSSMLRGMVDLLENIRGGSLFEPK